MENPDLTLPIEQASVLTEESCTGIEQVPDERQASNSEDEQGLAHLNVEMKHLGRGDSVAPILSLPDDLILEIFHELHDSEKNEESISNNAGHWTPEVLQEQRYSSIRLSQVCQRFRLIALGDAVLWSTIRINMDMDMDMLSEPRKEIWRGTKLWLKCFLERSHQAPLKVDFFGAWNKRFHCHSELTRTVFSHAPRIISLDAPLALLRSVVSYPTLESLRSLQIYYEPDPESGETVIHLGFPSLKHASVSFPQTRLIWGIPWTNLSSLELWGDAQDMSDILGLLQIASNLEHLAVDVSKATGLGEEQITASLRSLSLNFVYNFEDDYDFNDGELFNSVFKKLKLLYLTSLQLISQYRLNGERVLVPLVQMLKRSSCSLTELTLKMLNLQTEKTDLLFDLFALTPHLRRLELEDEDYHNGLVTEEVIQGLTWSSDEVSRCLPTLESLSMGGLWLSGFGECLQSEPLVEMAQSRNGTLKSLSLTPCELIFPPMDGRPDTPYDTDKENMRWRDALKSVTEKGIQLSVSCCCTL